MNKEEWMHSLKVGDTVNDCRFKNLKIIEIRDFKMTKIQLPYWSWIPSWAFGAFDWLSRKLFGMIVIDKTLTLEDGNGCSAMHCCDPPSDNIDPSNATATRMS